MSIILHTTIIIITYCNYKMVGPWNKDTSSGNYIQARSLLYSVYISCVRVQMSKRISKTLEATRFSGALIVPVAAKPGGPEAPPTQGALGIDHLIQVTKGYVKLWLEIFLLDFLLINQDIFF